MAGIAVATVLGGLGLLWACFSLFSSLTTEPAGAQAVLFRAFPGFQQAGLAMNSAAMVGCAAVLVGAFLSFFHDPQGHRVVRITCGAMLAAVVLGAILTGNLIVSSSTWKSLDDPAKVSLIGGIVGGVIGGVLQWALILFLFRNRRPAGR